MAREWELYNTYPAINGRPLNFVYFGGGTPSFLSVRQLERPGAAPEGGQRLGSTPKKSRSNASPGTLTESKLAAIRELGRDAAQPRHRKLRRSHSRAQRTRAPLGRDLPRVPIRPVARASRRSTSISIAGMLGETEENWQRCVQKTIELDPDSVTIYQMELPFNTTISSDVLKGTGRFQEHVASWSTKRRWVDEAFEALRTGRLHRRQRVHGREGSRADAVHLSRSVVAGRRSGRPRRRVVRPPQRRARAEPRHLGRIQRQDSRGGDLPLSRAYRPDPEERLIRELVLQLKLGRVRPPYFAEKVRSGHPSAVREPLARSATAGYLAEASDDLVALTRAGSAASGLAAAADSFSPSTPASATPESGRPAIRR